jgi:murein DD-endopeptidase MepM/ murein hydrolase activator NlpD
VSHQQARHRKPSRREAVRHQHARHRRQSALSSALRRGPAITAVVTGTTLLAGAGAAFAVTAWPASVPAASAGHRLPPALDKSQSARSLGMQPDGNASPAATPAASRPAPARTRASTHEPAGAARSHAAAPLYRNPLRDVTGLIPERVDMGADFGGNGPIYAIGPAVITNATGDSAGWPGGGWITYQLTSGPAKGLQVYVAEDVQPTVQVGQHVTSGTVIADMANKGDGIETGWAMPDGLSAESQLAVAGGISGGGPFPTDVGLNYDALLVALGAPVAPNFASTGYGTLPAGYPSSWASVRS